MVIGTRLWEKSPTITKTQMVKFKVYPDPAGKEYYDVCIFNSRKEMQDFSGSVTGMKQMHRNHEAMTISVDVYRVNKKKGTEKKLDMVGMLMFYKGGFGAGIVSHEIAHAMNYYFNRHKIDFDLGTDRISKKWKKWDEAYAWCLGSMVNQFWKEYYKNFRTLSKVETY